MSLLPILVLLGIHYILVQILLLKDLAPDLDPTPFYRDFKDAKNYFFPDFFLVTYPHYLQNFFFY